jgi:hypothetical protein
MAWRVQNPGPNFVVGGGYTVLDHSPPASDIMTRLMIALVAPSENFLVRLRFSFADYAERVGGSIR